MLDSSFKKTRTEQKKMMVWGKSGIEPSLKDLLDEIKKSKALSLLAIHGDFSIIFSGE
jgi:hypothetical protein